MSQNEYTILSWGSFEKPRLPTPGKGEDLVLDFHEGELPIIGVADGSSQGRGDLAKVIVEEEFAKWKVDLNPGIDIITAIESFVSQTQNRLLSKAREAKERSVETTLSLILPHDDKVYLLNIGENICNLFELNDNGQYIPTAMMGFYAFPPGSDIVPQNPITTIPPIRSMHLGSGYFKAGNLVSQGYLQCFGPPRRGFYRAVSATDGMFGIEGGYVELFPLSKDKSAQELERLLKSDKIIITQTDDMAFIGVDLKYRKTSA